MNLSEVLSLVSPHYDLDNRLEWWFSEIEIFHHNNFIQTSDGVSHHMLEDQYYMPVLSPTGLKIVYMNKDDAPIKQHRYISEILFWEFLSLIFKVEK